MTNLTIYNGQNSQEITLSGLLDSTSTPVVTASITATLARSGVTLPNSSMTFEPVPATPGNYVALLSGFDATPGPAQLVVTGSNAGITFNFTIFCTIAPRSL